MMRRTLCLVGLLALALPATVQAQSAAVQPASGKTLASTLSVYVFPSKGQKPETQSQDETACYTWAVQNTGSDPFSLQTQSQQQAQQTEQAKQQAAQAGKGAGASGAVKGAAAGALIGEIASDDAGKGAAYGAAAGVIAGRRRGAAAKQQATQQAEAQGAQAQAATAEQMANFKKAFSVCLEAKDYMVKY